MKRLGVVAKPDAAEAAGALRTLAGWAARRGLPLLVEKEAADLVPDLQLAAAGRADLPTQVDLLVVLGGDGTLLAVARAIGDLGIPIVGVNLGGLGFLTATTLDQMVPALEAFLRDELVIEERMMLATRVRRDGEVVGTWLALNDAVITKAAMSRIINLAVSVEGQYATAYRADGLIISTPTGSTAYSLSAGGPIVVPGVDAIVVTAISPHTLAVRPLVVSSQARVAVEPMPPWTDEVLVSFDGQVGTTMHQGERLVVRRAEYPVRLVRLGPEGFFARMRKKLQWGDLSDRERP